MTEFAASTPKSYSYLTNDYDERKKTKCTEKCVKKQTLKFEDLKNCLDANKLQKEMKQPEKIKLDSDALR